MSDRLRTAVLIHALGLDRGMWDPVRREHADAGGDAAEIEIVAVDLPGHGERFAEPVGPVESLADDLARRLDADGRASAVVIGCSFGGCIAMSLAVRRPDLVGALVLVATTPTGTPAVHDRGDDARRRGIEPVVASTLKRWLGADPAPGSLAYCRDRLVSVDPERWAEAWYSLGDFDARDRLGSIDVPVTVLVGDVDTSTPPSVAERIVAGVKNAELRVVPGAPHLLPLTHPAEVARAIADHARSSS
ncbi:MAG: alpha/beta fold hydrolase [Acidimicrobiales bacterium]